ncbi:hypothetical protein OC834_003732 [Tilletia horrida]|nr:hypothetical protein OC834_003732 [Tilletia horrida]
MSLLIAPYNNAMRLGQGFNTYLQQICIDDAVVIDPDRAENVVNNAGLTMKMLAEQTGVSSALERLPGLASSSIAIEPNTEQEEAVEPAAAPAVAKPRQGPGPSSFAIAAKQKEKEKEEMRKRRGAASGEPQPAGPAPKAPTAQQPQKKLSPQEERNKERADKLKAATSLTAKSLTEMKDTINDIHKRTDAQMRAAVQDVNGGEEYKELAWSAKEARGPAQIVNYTSKFVNKISEITDDLSISGSLSIKYNGIMGSGSGSFLDAEKFFDSDLKYFISVKVINSTINYKDALAFNPLRSCMRDEKKFNEVFGNAFISGFLEGGEFNAVVLMKVHNKNKMRDIQAQAKVALTAGPVEVSAQGNVALAEENITNNAETSIYVRWSGGGNIKPYDDEWTIKSVMAAAARFPALVGLFPQRTYAVLTKYENLRSYLELKPVRLTPLRYELAQLYTNQLSDAFLEYKSLVKRLSTDIADVQAGLKEIKIPSNRVAIPSSVSAAKLNYFAASLTGLDDARRAIRAQLNTIVAEIDLLTDHPETASSPTHKQPYIAPALFGILLPEVSVRDSRRRPNAAPLDVPRINNVGAIEEAKKAPVDTDDGENPPLFNPSTTSGVLSAQEQSALAELEWKSFGIGATYQVSMPVGDQDDGVAFCTLDYAQSGETVTELSALKDASGKLCSIVIGFSNGLLFTFGKPVDQVQLDQTPPAQKLAEIDSPKERILSGTIQILKGKSFKRVVGISLTTSESRKLEALYKPTAEEEPELSSHPIAVPASGFKVAGLWGRMIDDESTGYIARLGCVWGPAVSESEKDKSERRIASQSDSVFWARMGEPVKIKFKTPLLGKTPMLLGMHCLRSSGKDAVDSVQLGMAVDESKATNEEFELAVTTKKKEDSLLCYWMVIPEIKEVIVQSGEFVFDVSSGKAPTPFDLKFPRDFAEDEAPDVRCWFTELDVAPSAAGGPIQVKAVVLPNTATKLGCRLAIEAPESTKLRKIKVGWLAHRKPSQSNAEFVSGDLRVVCAEGKPKREIPLTNSKLSSDPVSKFIALNEIHADTKQAVCFTATFLPDTTKDAVHMDIGPLAESPVHALGLTWILTV